MDAQPDEQPSDPDLSIVIVTWNCRDLIDTCLAHVEAADKPFSHEVIVVDNASSDGTAAHVAERWPQVRLIESGGNLGFARGNNLGFAQARGRLVLLLNPDCFLIDKTALARTVERFASRPELAACGVRVTYPDGRHQVGDAGFRPSPATIVNHAFSLSAFAPGCHGIFLTRVPEATDGVAEVDWITGAFLLVRAEVIERVGGLDGTIFMYGEDCEWGCRMRDAGLRLGYFPDIAVVHLQGGTQVDPSKPPSTRWMDGLVAVYDRFYPGKRVYPRLALFLGFGLRALVYGLVGRMTGNAFQLQRAQACRVFSRHALTY